MVVESINYVMSDIVRMIIFVKDMWDAVVVEEVYVVFFIYYYLVKIVVVVVDLLLGVFV